MKKLIFILLFVPVILYGQRTVLNTYYIDSPDSTGSDVTGDGSIETPWATLDHAFESLGPGDTLNCMGGTYMSLIINKFDPETGTEVSGNRDSVIYIRGYPVDVANGDLPIIDCSRHIETYGFDNGYYNQAIAIEHSEFLYFKDIKVQHVWQLDSVLSGGITATTSRNLTFDHVVLEDCSQRGIYVQGGAWKTYYDLGLTGTAPYWTDNGIDTTRFINCDVSVLCDSITAVSCDPGPCVWSPGNGADAFRGDLYPDNVWIWEGCRAWHYSDDGWDVTSFGGKMIYKDCWVMSGNVYDDWIYASVGKHQEKNGWKLGGNQKVFTTERSAVLQNCLAIFNDYAGYDNNIFATQTNWYRNNAVFYNCAAFDSDGFGWLETSYLDSMGHTVWRNCLSYQNTYNLQAWNYAARESNNTFDYEVGQSPNTDTVTVTADDFYYDVTDSSGMVTLFTAARTYANGWGLPDNPLRLAESSDLINAGIVYPESDSVWDLITAGLIDTTYYGETMDIGPYQFGAESGQSGTHAITSWSFPKQISSATIDTTAHTVYVVVKGNKTNITPTFTHNGASASPLSEVVQDFTNPVTYRITSVVGTYVDYIVTVVAQNTGKAVGRSFRGLGRTIITER